MEHGAIISIDAAAALSNPIDNTLFYNWIRSLDATPKTAATYTRNIRPFGDFLIAHGIQNPTREDVIQYRAELKARGLKPATISAYLMALKQFFHWTEDAGLYPDISKKVKSPKLDESHKKDPLTVEQAAEILGSIDRDTEGGARDFAIIALMISAGLRSVEVTRANVGDIQTVSDGRESYIALMVQGKGRTEKNEIIKISDPVYLAIRDYLAKRETVEAAAPLFASISNHGRGGRLTPRSVSRICKNAMLNCGLDSPRLTAHSLRHTAATINLLNGGTPEETQQLMRHRNPKTTQIYSHALNRGNNNSEYRITRAVFEILEKQ